MGLHRPPVDIPPGRWTAHEHHAPATHNRPRGTQRRSRSPRRSDPASSDIHKHSHAGRAAAGATWWLIQAKHSDANPIALAITGGGIGLIASIYLTIPVAGVRAFTLMLSQGDRNFQQWLLHGPGYRALRWWIIASIYLAIMCWQASAILLWSTLFYALHHYLHGYFPWPMILVALAPAPAGAIIFGVPWLVATAVGRRSLRAKMAARLTGSINQQTNHM